MRDLKRANAKLPAYIQLKEEGFEVFTPMKWEIFNASGRRERRYVPFVRDLLFVHSTRADLDPTVNATPTLQYRFVKGGAYGEPLTVRAKEMDRFIRAVSSDLTPCYFNPSELTPSMYGRPIRIVGGPLDGYEGRLLSVKGMRKRRLIVELDGLLKVAVEVQPDFITLL